MKLFFGSYIIISNLYSFQPTGDGFVPMSGEPYNNNPNNQYENPQNPYQVIYSFSKMVAWCCIG